MIRLRNFVMKRPVIFVLTATITWFVLLVIPAGIVSSVINKPFDDPIIGTIARLTVTAGVIWLLWRLEWLKVSGVTRLGRWQVWLVALGGLIYMICGSLYSFFGKVAFDFSNLLLPGSKDVITTQFVVAVCEEIFFRGLVLYTLFRAWGNTQRGIIGSVLLSSLLFAALHTLQAFSLRAPALLLLIIESVITSVWWGALVLASGSIWPAVLLHFLVNAMVGVQSLTMPVTEPAILSYRNLLWFSLPLGVLGIWLVIRTRNTAKLRNIKSD